MKKRLVSIGCIFTVAWLSVSSARAEGGITGSTSDVAADALVVRPVSFVGTIVGSVVFVVTLPFTAPCGGVHTAAQALVITPAEYTFKRPLGDLETWDVDAL